MAGILHITHRYWPVQGGSEQYLWQIATRQAQAGHQVTVVTTNAVDLAYFWQPNAKCLPAGETAVANVRIIRVPVQHLPGTPWTFGILRRLQLVLSRLPGLARYAGLLARGAPYLPDLDKTLTDLSTNWQFVFSWNITFDGLMAAARQAAEKSRCHFLAVPFIHLGEGPHSSLRRFYTMPHQIDLLKSADQVIVQTEIEHAYLAGQGIDPHKLTLVGAGIDPETLSGGDGDAFRQRHQLSGPIVTAVGPLTADKGTVHLLKAARLLWQQGRRFNLVLAGNIMDDFRTEWQHLPPLFREHCHCLGEISEAEKRDLLAAAAVLALPSRTESFGIVLLEAWFYGKPVIAARAGALAAVVNDGVNGRLVPFGDISALAAAITEILESPEQNRQWGRNGRDKTLNQFTWEMVYKRFDESVAMHEWRQVN
jgi:glycosyltransferase involved in cell wall biosynthesis